MPMGIEEHREAKVEGQTRKGKEGDEEARRHPLITTHKEGESPIRRGGDRSKVHEEYRRRRKWLQKNRKRQIKRKREEVVKRAAEEDHNVGNQMWQKP